MKVIHESVHEEHEEEPGSWLVSLIFWGCLIAAVGLYATVALAPKLHKYLEIRAQYTANQMRLVRLEREISYLKRVRDALENDPEFAAQMAKVDFQIGRTDTELIPVNPELSRDARDFTSGAEPAVSQVEPSHPFLELIANSHFWRSFLITMAAGLTLTAFTFLNHPQARRAREAARKRNAEPTRSKPHASFWSRYQRPAPRQKMSDV